MHTCQAKHDCVFDVCIVYVAGFLSVIFFDATVAVVLKYSAGGFSH
jgi:hypothetical protein